MVKIPTFVLITRYIAAYQILNIRLCAVVAKQTIARKIIDII